jgi:CDP-4-dehydro-6-deoxyglucose reductase
MVLYWGVRTKADLYYYDLAQSWVNDRFKFIPVLSEPLPEDQWQGRTGLVHEAILADYPDLSGYQVYACGAPIMVESGYKAFTQTRALPEDEFYSDPFTPSVDNKATS